MRIAINATFLGGRAEGIDTYTRSMIEALAVPGNEVLIYSPEPHGGEGGNSVQWRPTPKGLSTAGGRFAKFRASAWCPAVLPLHVLRDRVDLLLCPVPEGMLAPVCPQVVVVHDLIPLFDPATSRLRRGYFKHVVPRLLKASSSVVAISEQTKKDLVSSLGVPAEKITVIYNWLDPLFLSDEPGGPPEGHEAGPYFLFVGRASPHKNLDMVIRAFAAIHTQVAHHLVCVVGFTGPRDREHYEENLDLATRLGVREKLRVYSGIPRSQLLYLYRNATALVLLSKYEGFGYPPLEAMAVGTPAIVSDSNALAEIAGPGAVCVPNTEPGPAAEAMKKLALDSSYRAAMAGKGRAHARQFSRERAMGLIRSVIETRQTHGRRASLPQGADPAKR